MIFNEEEFPNSIQAFNKIYQSMVRTKESMETILKDVKNNWQSSASDQLIINIRNSIKKLDTYINQVSKIKDYMDETLDLYLTNQATGIKIADEALNSSGSIKEE
ncbi:MAG: hypothetical protein IJH20_02425 [Bacilli bacterium]|nr:hypothetical protein [Bacilli bacterium]